MQALALVEVELCICELEVGQVAVVWVELGIGEVEVGQVAALVGVKHVVEVGVE